MGEAGQELTVQTDRLQVEGMWVLALRPVFFCRLTFFIHNASDARCRLYTSPDSSGMACHSVRP